MDGKILNIELAMKDYNNYIYKIIKNKYNNFSDEDIEEIILDVFLTLWNNQNKLDINQKMSSYIAGITKNLIKKKYRTNNNDENIEDYVQAISYLLGIYVNIRKNSLLFSSSFLWIVLFSGLSIYLFKFQKYCEKKAFQIEKVMKYI